MNQIIQTKLGSTVLVIEDTNRPWHSLADYDEYTSNSIGIAKEHWAVSNLNTKMFSNNQSFIEYLYDHLNTDVGAYCVPYAEKTKQNWQLETSVMKDTHGDIFHLDYDKIAYQIMSNRWKPVLDNYVKYMEQNIEDDYSYNVATQLSTMLDIITFKNFELTAPISEDLENVANNLVEYFNNVDSVEDKQEILRVYNLFIERVKEAMNIPEQGFKTKHLDSFIEFFHEMDYGSNDFTLCTPDGEPALDVSELMRNTLFDLYFKYNPYTFLGGVSQNHLDYSLSIFPKDVEVNKDVFNDNNAIIIATDLAAANSIVESVNQFLNGSWYIAQEIKIITDENKHEVQIKDVKITDDGTHYVELDVCVGGYDSVEAIEEDF